MPNAGVTAISQSSVEFVYLPYLWYGVKEEGREGAESTEIYVQHADYESHIMFSLVAAVMGINISKRGKDQKGPDAAAQPRPEADAPEPVTVTESSPDPVQDEIYRLQQEKKEVEKQLQLRDIRREVAELKSRLSNEDSRSTGEHSRLSFSTVSSHPNEASPFKTDSPEVEAIVTPDPEIAAKPHMTFHPGARAKNIRIETEGRAARTVNSFKLGICFSREQISVGEKVQLK
ncbi:hypothetical protein Bbelb_159760 [Branchiostoma belcheri]|nr:hypothetical protein Bbelb_159760 [Branchiostoma belcheri]